MITLQYTISNHQEVESGEIGDTVVEVLTSISCWTGSTETVTIPETQDNDRINYFLVISPSQ